MSDFLDLQGAKDLNTDAIHIGAVANSVDPATGAPIDAHVNRVGGTDYTLHGFWNALGPVVMPWTSATGGTLTQPNQAFLHPANGNYYSWTGTYPDGGYVVAPGTDPTQSGSGYVPRTDIVLRGEMAGDNGDILIPSIYKSAGCIMASRHGVVSGIDCAPVIQALQDLSEQYRIPIDFSGISVVTFSGKVQFGDYFYWKSSGRFNSTIKPLTKTRSALGVGPQGVYAWFGPKDPTVSIKHAMLEDIGFDGGYDVGTHSTPTDRLIRAFCWHAHAGAKHTDITALRVHAVDCPHEFWEGYTTSGGEIDGIRMLFCSGGVADPLVSAVGCNFFKCMNGTIDGPGPYGVYTIRNVVSFGNTCRGWRTLNDFKRGSERWNISACETIDMNDCHHSADGSRAGTFDASNKGWQTGASRATKNYLELQGENIDVMGFQYDADKGGSTKRGVAAVFITDYEYSANGGDTSGNNRRQSKNINVFSGTAKNINHHAVRFINSYKCGAGNVFASQCLYGAVAFEFVSTHVDTDTGLQIPSVKNWLGAVTTESCQYEVLASSGADFVIREVPRNSSDGSRASLDAGCTYSVGYTPKILNAANTMLKVADFWTSGGAAKTDYTTPPLGSAYAFELSDVNTASIQTYDWGGKIPLSQANCEYLYVKLWALAGTATTSALIIQEYTSSDTLVSTVFKKLNPTASWVEKKLVHNPSASTVAYVVVKLAPACDDYNTPTLTGTTRFADIRISKEPI